MGSEILRRVYGDTLELLLTAFEPATAGDNEAILIGRGKTDLCDGQPKQSATCFCNM